MMMGLGLNNGNADKELFFFSRFGQAMLYAMTLPMPYPLQLPGSPPSKGLDPSFARSLA